MSAGQIMHGIGNGSLFGYGRIFGVHNPFGSAVGKAADPYINMRRVVSCSNSPDSAVKAAVISTLRAKIEHGFDTVFFPSINRDVMVRALSRADFIGHRLDAAGKVIFINCVQRFVTGCSIQELGILSNSDSSVIFEAVQRAADPHKREIMETSVARYLAIFTRKEYAVNMLPSFKNHIPEHHLCYVSGSVDDAVKLLSFAHYKDDPGETYTRGEILKELAAINPVLAQLINERLERGVSNALPS